jgi:hypothetical protein
MKKNIAILTAALLGSSIAFYSCSKDGSDNQGSSTLHVRLTDAPTAYEEVNVDIREVNIKFSDDSLNTGWITLNTFPGIYKLLDLQNGVDTLLATGAFPFQTVKEIRFVLGPNNSIKDAGVIYPLTVPSGSESGLKLKISKDLNETLETIIIDFDAELSVIKNGAGDYKLRPVLRIK